MHFSFPTKYFLVFKPNRFNSDWIAYEFNSVPIWVSINYLLWWKMCFRSFTRPFTGASNLISGHFHENVNSCKLQSQHKSIIYWSKSENFPRLFSDSFGPVCDSTCIEVEWNERRRSYKKRMGHNEDSSSGTCMLAINSEVRHKFNFLLTLHNAIRPSTLTYIQTQKIKYRWKIEYS